MKLFHSPVKTVNTVIKPTNKRHVSIIQIITILIHKMNNDIYLNRSSRKMQSFTGIQPTTLQTPINK